jgi:hypothetical protein
MLLPENWIESFAFPLLLGSRHALGVALSIVATNQKSEIIGGK